MTRSSFGFIRDVPGLLLSSVYNCYRYRNVTVSISNEHIDENVSNDLISSYSCNLQSNDNLALAIKKKTGVNHT